MPTPTYRTLTKTGIFFALVVLLLTVAWAYRPGLNGSFLLDDEDNLATLIDNNGVHNWHDFVSYITSGHAGALGRPISLATFAADTFNQPVSPRPFKLTNLLIHLFNTLLIFVLARQLLLLAGNRRPTLGAVLCAALWALHPLQVSTVLYVVQRMTELAACFTLLGLLLFVHGRVVAAASPLRGYTWIAIGIGVCGLLATLSKESGSLLPLLALCIEFALLSTATQRPPHWRPLGFLLLWTPVLLLAGYLALEWPSMLHAYATRDFTLSERLLTEGRVLVDYLYELVLPRLSSAGLFYDDYPVSHGWLTPATTLFAWLLIAALVAVALTVRRNQPLLALGLLFFFAGHALESSFIPLELYFEHRNYLPAFGIALIAAHYGARLLQEKPVIGVLAIVAFLGMEVWITHQQTQVWGNDLLSAQIWPMERPDSLRAQQFAARFWMSNGNNALAKNYIDKFVEKSPRNTTGRLQAIELRCDAGSPVDAYARESLDVLRTGTFDLAGPDSLARIQQLAAEQRCADIQASTVMTMIDAYADNPLVREQNEQLGYVLFIKASAFAAQDRIDLAVATIDTAARLRKSLFASYWQTLWLANAHRLPEAKMYFARALDDYHRRFGHDTALDTQMKALQQRIVPESSPSEK